MVVLLLAVCGLAHGAGFWLERSEATRSALAIAGVAAAIGALWVGADAADPTYVVLVAGLVGASSAAVVAAEAGRLAAAWAGALAVAWASGMGSVGLDVPVESGAGLVGWAALVGGAGALGSAQLRASWLALAVAASVGCAYLALGWHDGVPVQTEAGVAVHVVAVERLGDVRRGLVAPLGLPFAGSLVLGSVLGGLALAGAALASGRAPTLGRACAAFALLAWALAARGAAAARFVLDDVAELARSARPTGSGAYERAFLVPDVDEVLVRGLVVWALALVALLSAFAMRERPTARTTRPAEWSVVLGLGAVGVGSWMDAGIDAAWPVLAVLAASLLFGTAGTLAAREPLRASAAAMVVGCTVFFVIALGGSL